VLLKNNATDKFVLFNCSTSIITSDTTTSITDSATSVTLTTQSIPTTETVTVVVTSEIDHTTVLVGTQSTTLLGQPTTVTLIQTTISSTTQTTVSVTYTTDQKDPTPSVQKRSTSAATLGPIPTYASVCSDLDAYSSACACLGVSPFTITITSTAETPTVAVTADYTFTSSIESTLLSTLATTTTLSLSTSISSTTLTSFTTTSASTVITSVHTTTTLDHTTKVTTTTSFQPISTVGSQRFNLRLSGSSYSGQLLNQVATAPGVDTTLLVPPEEGGTVATCVIDSSRQVICNNQYLVIAADSYDQSVYGYDSGSLGALAANGHPTIKCDVSAAPAYLLTCDAYSGYSAFYFSTGFPYLTYQNPSSLSTGFTPVSVQAVFI
jgi:hypothetical protein